MHVWYMHMSLMHVMDAHVCIKILVPLHLGSDQLCYCQNCRAYTRYAFPHVGFYVDSLWGMTYLILVQS